MEGIQTIELLLFMILMLPFPLTGDFFIRMWKAVWLM